MRRFCKRGHVSVAEDCRRAVYRGVAGHERRCPLCGSVTYAVGDWSVLSPKQLDVVVAMHANPEKTHKELAPMLLITEGSLKVYLSRIYLALGCNTSRALVLLWERRLRGVPGSVVSTVATVEAGKSAVQ